VATAPGGNYQKRKERVVMERRGSNRGKRMRKWILIFSLFLIGAAAILGVFFRGSGADSSRMTVVLVSDPVTLVSWDKTANTLTLVFLPSDTIIDGTHGYGQYSLDALWKLGTIDRKEGILISESIEELLGIPVSYYIKRPELLGKKDARVLVGEMFALSTIPSFFTGKYISNMPFSSFFSFSWAAARIPPQNIRTIDLSQGRILTEQTIPDGSTVHVVDKDRLDQKVGSFFEDERIRKEGYTVAVFNTTQSSSLGNRVSRLLTHLGVRVVAVGNDNPELSRCTVTGGKKELASVTASSIVRIYDCAKNVVEDFSKRADLVVRIGTSYQARFLPFPAKK